MIRTNFTKYHPKYAKVSDFGSHFGASCVIDSRGGTFFRDLFFGTSGRYPPWTEFGIPWDTPGQILSPFWKMLVANLLQSSKIPAQQISPTTPSKKQARMRTNFTDNQSKWNMFHFCCFTKPRKSEAPGLKTIGSAELHKGQQSAAPCSQGTGRPKFFANSDEFFWLYKLQKLFGEQGCSAEPTGTDSLFTFFQIFYDFVHLFERSKNHQKSDLYQTLPKSQKSDPWMPKARFWTHFGWLLASLFRSIFLTA